MVDEDKKYIQAIVVNLGASLCVVIATVLVFCFDKSWAIAQAGVALTALVILIIYYVKIQYHEIRTLLRLFLAVDLICLFLGVPLLM